MLNEKDILNLLQEYVRVPENRKWLEKHHGVDIGINTDVLLEIKQELEAAITTVLPNFNMSSVRCVRDTQVGGVAKYSIVIDITSLRRESLHYTTKEGKRVQGEGIDDILALFTHGYTLKHRVPYGIWDKSDGSSMRIKALPHRDPNPFLQDLCKELNAKYHDVCEITLNDDYKL